MIDLWKLLRRGGWIGLALWTLAACTGTASPAAPAPVDPGQTIIFYNGPILTMRPDGPVQVEALAVRGEMIEALGSERDILARQEPGTLLVDLGGRTLMPGFVDSHTHVLNDARSQGQSLDEAQYAALRAGITTIGDLYVDESFLRELRAFDEAGLLRLRTSAYLPATDPCGRRLGTWYEAYPPTRTPGERLRIGGVKLFTDGGSCGVVALSFELAPGGGTGDLWFTQDELNELVARAQAKGYQVAIHAIGDRAVREAQAAVAAALAGGPNVYRHRLEHVSVLPPETIGRFGELGLIPTINGEYPACTPFGPPIPEPYHAWEWPWRALRDQNPELAIAWESDYPFLSLNPLVHLYGFVTRMDAPSYYTCAPGEWLRHDLLTVDEALTIMTREAAYALFRENEVGSLAPGLYADLIVISDNPLTVPAEDLRRLSVLATMVGGRYEFCNPRNLELCPGYVARTPLPLPDLRPSVPLRYLILGLVVAAPLATVWLGRKRLATVGGVAALLGGALWAWLWLYAELNTPESETGRLIGPMLVGAALLVVAGAGLGRTVRATRWGQVALLGASLGILTMALSFPLGMWFDLEAAWAMILVGLLVHGLGLSLYGLINWFTRRRSLVALWPLAIGLVGGIAPVPLSGLSGNEALGPICLGLGVGVGWMVAGALMLRAALTRPVGVAPQAAPATD